MLLELMPLLGQLTSLAVGYAWPGEKGARVADMITRVSSLGAINPKSPEFLEQVIGLSGAGAQLAFGDAKGVKIANLIGTLGEVATMEYKEEMARQGKTEEDLHEHALSVFQSEDGEYARMEAKFAAKLNAPTQKLKLPNPSGATES